VSSERSRQVCGCWSIIGRELLADEVCNRPFRSIIQPHRNQTVKSSPTTKSATAAYVQLRSSSSTRSDGFTSQSVTGLSPRSRAGIRRKIAWSSPKRRALRGVSEHPSTAAARTPRAQHHRDLSSSDRSGRSALQRSANSCLSVE
jgi:hypothetical protein